METKYCFLIMMNSYKTAKANTIKNYSGRRVTNTHMICLLAFANSHC
jgi:hypothetical protein